MKLLWEQDGLKSWCHATFREISPTGIVAMETTVLHPKTVLLHVNDVIKRFL